MEYFMDYGLNAKDYSNRDFTNFQFQPQIKKEKPLPTYQSFNAWSEGSGASDYEIADTSLGGEKFQDAWFKGIDSLAKTNLESSDLNGNSGIDYNEFVNQELSSYNKIFVGEEIEYDKNTGEIKNYPEMNEHLLKSFEAIDADKSGKLELDEIKTVYATLDGLDSGNNSADGKIKSSSMTVDFYNDKFVNLFNSAGAKLFNPDFKE